MPGLRARTSILVAQSASESDSGSDTEPPLSSDPDTDPEFVGHSDSEGEELRQRINFHRGQGRAKSRRKPWSNSLIGREYANWTAYCSKITREPDEMLQACESETFKAYLEWRVEKFRITKESTIKCYWRRMLSKYIDVTGHSMNDGTELDIQDWIPTYLTPTYGLNTSDKEKDALFSEDMHVMICGYWAVDSRPRHGRMRVQTTLIWLLAGATATRLGALVESSSARGSNKGLTYEHIALAKVRNARDPKSITTVAWVTLAHVKNAGGTGRRKTFIFRLEEVLGFCIVSFILSLALADGAFRHHYRSVREIFDLRIPAHKEMLKLKFKKGIADQPLFPDLPFAEFRLQDAAPTSQYVSNLRGLQSQQGTESTTLSGTVFDGLSPGSTEKTVSRRPPARYHQKNATSVLQVPGETDQVPSREEHSKPVRKMLPYNKARTELVWVGRLLGFEKGIEFYDIRRAQGKNINRDPNTSLEEQNQTMGHRRGTYERFYVPELIARDFQSIYFGTPSQDFLIQRIARMGATRDEGAPTTLTEAQAAEVSEDPHLVGLRQKRDEYKRRLQAKGYRPVENARGTRLFRKYDESRREANSVKERLKRERLNRAIAEYHDTADEMEINRQLAGVVAIPQATRPRLKFEFRERAVIVALLSQPLSELSERDDTKLRVTFIDTLVHYCQIQERQPYRQSTASVEQPLLTTSEGNGSLGRKRGPGRPIDPALRKRQKPELSPCPQSGDPSPPRLPAEPIKIEETEGDPIEVIPDLFPMKLNGPVCLVCIGDGRLSVERRLAPFSRKSTLQKHIDSHVNEGYFQQKFECSHPCCSEWIQGLQHFMAHAARAHNVWHQVKRT